MNKNMNIILSLAGNDSNSRLKALVYEEELREINSKYPLAENKIDINQTFFNRNENILEIGFFIRNTMPKKVSFENILLVLENQYGKVILDKEFHFKDNAVMLPYSARHFVVNFELSEDIEFNDDEQYTIKFGGANSIEAISSVPTIIDNLPIDISYEEEIKIKDFVKGLNTLRKDEFTISIFNIIKNNKGGLDCFILFRNGYDKEINLKKLPICIYNDCGIIIAQKLFESDKVLVKVNPKKSKFLKFEFRQSDILSEMCEFSKCKVTFQ